MSEREPIRVRVDVRNPGQFFACCGLFELADRLWPGVEAWFEEGEFAIGGGGSLSELLKCATTAEIVQLNLNDDKASPILLAGSLPKPLRLDWWLDKSSGGQSLKLWAGSQGNIRILHHMQLAVKHQITWDASVLDASMVVFVAPTGKDKVEPFYFDSRKGANSHTRDVGFSCNEHKFSSTASPATEMFAFVGLQRFRPAELNRRNVFAYSTWRPALPIVAATAAVVGIGAGGAQQFVFQTRKRGKDSEAFWPATSVASSE